MVKKNKMRYLIITGSSSKTIGTITTVYYYGEKFPTMEMGVLRENNINCITFLKELSKEDFFTSIRNRYSRKLKKVK